MARAVWTGSLSFGLVTIPVRLYPATEAKDVRFHLMDATGRRVRYRRFVQGEEPAAGWESEGPGGEPVPRWESEGPADEPDADRQPEGESAAKGDERPQAAEVAYEDLMRGYETEDGRVVLLTQEEVESARPERSRSIEIEDFVALSDIDPVFFEKSYHLAPQRGGERLYLLLLRAMERAGRIGIGRFVLRTKPHLVAIRPEEGLIGLETMFFGDEVRDGRELAWSTEGLEVSERELRMAEMLIETLKTEWNPAAYSDTYREELLRRIGEKAPIEERAEAAAPGSGSRAEELMEALKASVEAAKKQKKRSPKRTA
jgi:DNA end-binding protein Ku